VATKALSKSEIAQKQLEALQAAGLDINDLLETMGLAAVAKDDAASSRISRKAVQEEWLSKRGLDEVEAAVVTSLPELIGKGETDGEGELTQEQIDALAQELAAERAAEDIVKGRIGAIRRRFFSLFDARNGDNAKGQVVSVAAGIKISREVPEAKADLDRAALEEALGEKKFRALCDEVVTYEVNPVKLAQAVEKDKKVKTAVEEAMVVSQPSPRFTVRALKAGDRVA
jgi:hypothetical protein